jgi:hypothetical protein
MEQNHIFIADKIESYTFTELHNLKIKVIGDTTFAHRMSIGFVARMVELLRTDARDYHSVMSEVRALEGGPQTSTKLATQFRHPPLYPLWHKHFYAPRHTIKNICQRWGIDGGRGNNDLNKKLIDISKQYGPEVARWPSDAGRMLTLGALGERSAAQRVTGDWIVFGVHNNKKYYLDLASHEEGNGGDANQLFKKLTDGGAAEFPFLFPKRDYGDAISIGITAT